MHGFEPLLLSPPMFHRRFRWDENGWVYDPSLGRAPGRPVSDVEARKARRDFDDLHQLLTKRIDRAAKIFIPSLFILPVLLISAGLIQWAATGMAICIALLILTVVWANKRLFGFSIRFWKHIEARPHSGVLTINEQIERGYRSSWSNRFMAFVVSVALIPAYVSAHNQHNIVRDIPVYGELASAIYWILLALIGGSFLTFLLVRRLVRKMAVWKQTLQSEERGLGNISPPVPPTKSKNTKVEPYPRGQLSGIDRTK